jgi:hypothetical protein
MTTTSEHTCRTALKSCSTNRKEVWLRAQNPTIKPVSASVSAGERPEQISSHKTTSGAGKTEKEIVLGSHPSILISSTIHNEIIKKTYW